jgi:hypothetical protein
MINDIVVLFSFLVDNFSIVYLIYLPGRKKTRCTYLKQALLA